jgi:hypothetical protein
LVAVADYASIYTSTNSGATWISNSAPSMYWQSVASSADGSRMAAVAWDGGVYTSQSIPAPGLIITPSGGNALISWTIPSANFVLQQNSDLTATHWLDVQTPPTVTNYENRATVSPTNANSFYRLKGL